MANTADPTQDRIRRRLRELRTERGMTLEDVATRAAMSPSTLSRLESGARRLAVDHLVPLAAALHVPVDELLRADPVPLDPRIRAEPLRLGDARVWPLSRATPGSDAPRVFRMELPPSGARGEQRSHTGYEWLYVLAGRVRLALGDEEELVLVPGEAAEFDTRTPHWMGAAGGPAEVLVIYGPQGERAHLRT